VTLQILIDGVDITSIDIEHYRRSVALVSQEPKLFNLSIAENIVYGMSRDVTEVCVDERCGACCEHGCRVRSRVRRSRPVRQRLWRSSRSGTRRAWGSGAHS
jgi:ABC-type sugar transport system ATPase subunit